MSERLAQVIEAELVLAADTNPAAVGAAVTIELCGSTDHDGPCRWPMRASPSPIRSRR